MRKHLYLVTEHETDEYVGNVMLTDQKRLTPEKNREADHTVRRDGEFVDIGRIVCLGYADFEDEADLKERFPEVADRKLREVDAKWREKAGVELDDAADEEIVTDGGEVPDETHLGEDGLWIPPALREFERQVVIRTPSNTQQVFSSDGEIGPYYGMVRREDFGDADEFHDAKNPDLAPDKVSIKPQGEDAVVLTVDLEPEVRCDGGARRVYEARVEPRGFSTENSLTNMLFTGPITARSWCEAVIEERLEKPTTDWTHDTDYGDRWSMEIPSEREYRAVVRGRNLHETLDEPVRKMREVLDEMDRGEGAVTDGGHKEYYPPPHETPDHPEPDWEHSCIDCGDDAYNHRCGGCGFPLCGRHHETGGGFCTNHDIVAGVSACFHEHEVALLHQRPDIEDVPTLLADPEHDIWHFPEAHEEVKAYQAEPEPGQTLCHRDGEPGPQPEVAEDRNPCTFCVEIARAILEKRSLRRQASWADTLSWRDEDETYWGDSA